MRRKSIIILAFVLVFALMVTACATRRPLQNTVQPRSNTTGLYNNQGTGTGTTGTGARTNTGTYTGSTNPYDLGYGTGTNYGRYGMTGTNTGTGTYYGRYGMTGTNTGTYNGYGTTGTSTNYGGYTGYNGYGAAGSGYNYGGTGAAGNYGGAGATGTYGSNGGATGYYGGGVTGMGSPVYYGGYGGYGGYNMGMYGGYGNDYRNVGGGNNSPNYSLNGAGGTTQADNIQRSVEQMVGVDNAAVVVSGNTAYVGIDTDGDLTGRNIAYGNATDLTALKRSVAQRVRTASPQIQTVYVSTDANFFERIRRVGTGLRVGNPLSGFSNELTNLVRGMTPERQ